ncbi:MAG: carboxypeptidase regulatory-like domain-containing protein [Phycisphaerae bacterium]|nr:carboxypeptidase regulatory-like domain-containing protein [Phycisphaerae bacterium]
MSNGVVRAGLAGLILLVLTMPVAADTWPTYSSLGPDLLAYETAYPALAKRYDLGLSVQGRHMWAIRISDNVTVEEDEPEVRYISTMHGNEITGVKMCMNLVDYLLTNYGTDPQVANIVDELDLWILPLMNPDGYDQTYRERENANGVDLNRNFPEGTYGDPNTPAGHAIEVQNIMNWCFGRSFVLAANFHGGALVVNYPFDNDSLGSVFSPTPDEDLFVYISEEYSYLNPPMWGSTSFLHGITNGADWYSIDGGMQDWSYRYMGCNEVTIEIGTKEPPESQIPTYWAENRDSMLAYLETALIGVRGIVTDSTTGLPLSATVSVVGRDHPVYTDPVVGNYHRMLLPGTYDLVFEVDGYDPITVTGVVVNAGAATRLDVQFGPPPAVTYPNGGEELPVGVPVQVTWAGNATSRYQVQYSGNYGDFSAVTDGFERPSLGSDYTTGGDAAWYTSTGTVHGGVRAARAGGITHSQTTWMTRAAQGGTLSFWHRASCESGYDFFNFYVDGVRKLHVSGYPSWAKYTETLPPGSHLLKWEYTKDGGVNGGSDTVWIDDLEMTVDNTSWTDIVAQTEVGASSAPWTPTSVGDQYKVRVRADYGSFYGDWDESDAVFSVVAVASGDVEPDGDVDLADFAAFQECMGAAAAGVCGATFEFVEDGLIDLSDYVEFAARMTGPQ